MLTGAATHLGIFDALNRCSKVCENLSPRLTAGTKIAAAGLLLAAPCELLLPASLLSSDVQRFFSRNWQILKTGKVSVDVASGRSWTDRMLEIVHQHNNRRDSLLSRWVISRVLGSVGITGASLGDTVRELALGVLIGLYAMGTKSGELVLKRHVNPLNLVNASGQGAWNHLRDAVIHAVTVVVAPVLGLIAPTKLLLPVMVKINSSSSTPSYFLDRMKRTCLISTRQILRIGAGLVGLATFGYTTGALSALKAVVLPFVPHMTFPLTRKLLAAIAGGSRAPGSVVAEWLRLAIEDLMNQLPPEQRRFLLENQQLLVERFGVLSSSVNWGLDAPVLLLFASAVWQLSRSVIRLRGLQRKMTDLLTEKQFKQSQTLVPTPQCETLCFSRQDFTRLQAVIEELQGETTDLLTEKQINQFKMLVPAPQDAALWCSSQDFTRLQNGLRHLRDRYVTAQSAEQRSSYQLLSQQLLFSSASTFETTCRAVNELYPYRAPIEGPVSDHEVPASFKPAFTALQEQRTSDPSRWNTFLDSRAGLSTTTQGNTRNDRRARQQWLAAEARMAEWATERVDITLESMSKIHVLLCQNLEMNSGIAGQYRNQHIRGGGKWYIKPEYVNGEIQAFLQWLACSLDECDRNSTSLPLIVGTAAKAQQWLLSIHPFTDGNGRTTRLVMDYVLQRYGIIPPLLTDNTVAVFPELPYSRNVSADSAFKKVWEGIQESYRYWDMTL